MATKYDRDHTSVQHVGVPFNYVRGNPAPIDDYQVWTTLEAAQEYAASSPVAYVGQILTVADGNGAVQAYMIADEAGSLVRAADEAEAQKLAEDINSISSMMDVHEKKGVLYFGDLTAGYEQNELTNFLDENFKDHGYQFRTGFQYRAIASADLDGTFIGAKDILMFSKDVVLSDAVWNDIVLIRDAEAECTELSGAVETAKASIIALSNRETAAEADIQFLSGQHDSLSAMLSADIDSLSNALSNEIDSLSAALSADVNALSTSLSNEVDAIAAIAEELIGKAQADISFLSTAHGTLSDSVSADVDALSTSLSTTVQLSVESLQGQVDAAAEDLTDAKEELSNVLSSYTDSTADRLSADIKNGKYALYDQFSFTYDSNSHYLAVMLKDQLGNSKTLSVDSTDFIKNRIVDHLQVTEDSTGTKVLRVFWRNATGSLDYTDIKVSDLAQVYHAGFGISIADDLTLSVTEDIATAAALTDVAATVNTLSTVTYSELTAATAAAAVHADSIQEYVNALSSESDDSPGIVKQIKQNITALCADLTGTADGSMNKRMTSAEAEIIGLKAADSVQQAYLDQLSAADGHIATLSAAIDSTAADVGALKEISAQQHTDVEALKMYTDDLSNMTVVVPGTKYPVYKGIIPSLSTSIAKLRDEVGTGVTIAGHIGLARNTTDPYVPTYKDDTLSGIFDYFNLAEAGTIRNGNAYSINILGLDESDPEDLAKAYFDTRDAVPFRLAHKDYIIIHSHDKTIVDLSDLTGCVEIVPAVRFFEHYQLSTDLVAESTYVSELALSVESISSIVDTLSTALSTDIDSLSTSLSSTVDAISADLCGQIHANDADIEFLSGQHDWLSAALSADVDSLSTSLSGTVDSISADLLGQVQANDADIAYLSGQHDWLSDAISADVKALSAALSAEVNSLSDALSADIDSLSTSLSSTVDAAAKTLSAAVDSKIYIDGVSAISLSARHEDATTYYEKVIEETVLSNELYILSSEYINCYGEQVKNVADPTSPEDAVNKKYADAQHAVAEGKACLSIETAVQAFNSGTEALSTALSTDIEALSAALSADIQSLSADLSSEVDSLSDSLSADICSLSDSISADIQQLSTSLSTSVDAISADLLGQICSNDSDISYLSGQHDWLSSAVSADIKALSTSLSNTIDDADAALNDMLNKKIYIDGLSAKTLSALHEDVTKYYEKVIEETVLSNELYVLSSEYVNAYGEQIKNVADPTDPEDAINKKYADSQHQLIDTSKLGTEEFSALSISIGLNAASSSDHVAVKSDLTSFITEAALAPYVLKSTVRTAFEGIDDTSDVTEIGAALKSLYEALA